MKMITCPVCGVVFKSYGDKTCSWVCRNRKMSKDYAGKVFTEEHKRNISKNHHNVSGSNNPRWNGGKREHSGYIEVWKPEHPSANLDGYVREHRLVIEESIGRYLEIGEVVHHINHVKDDNRLENLKLYKSTSEHLRYGHTLSIEEKAFDLVSCRMCKVKFYKSRCQVRITANNYCSRVCYMKKRWGKK